MRPPRRKAPVRRGTQPVPALERQPRGPQHLGPAAAERQSPGSVTPSPAWPPVIATPSVGVPFHRTSEYLRAVQVSNARAPEAVRARISVIVGVCNAVTAPSELPFRDFHGDQGVPAFGESWTVWKTLKPKFESMQKASRWPPCSPLMPLNTAGSVLQPFSTRRLGPPQRIPVPESCQTCSRSPLVLRANTSSLPSAFVAMPGTPT